MYTFQIYCPGSKITIENKNRNFLHALEVINKEYF